MLAAIVVAVQAEGRFDATETRN